MATALSTTSVLCWGNPQNLHVLPSPHTPCHSSQQIGILRTLAASASKGRESEKFSSLLVTRRTVLASGVSLLGFPGESLAVVTQGLLAGRIPGLSEPDEQGSFTLDYNK